jgi:hypothetical protein
VAVLGDYLDLTVSKAREQYRALAARRPVASGKQVTFLPVETLLCLAASFVVNAHQFGGATAHRHDTIHTRQPAATSTQKSLESHVR